MSNCSIITFICLVILLIILVVISYKEKYTTIATYDNDNSVDTITKTDFEENLLTKIKLDDLFLKRDELLTVNREDGTPYIYMLYRQNGEGGETLIKYWYYNYEYPFKFTGGNKMRMAGIEAAKHQFNAFMVDPSDEVDEIDPQDSGATVVMKSSIKSINLSKKPLTQSELNNYEAQGLGGIYPKHRYIANYFYIKIK